MKLSSLLSCQVIYWTNQTFFFFFLLALVFKFLLKLAVLLEQLVKFLCYYYGWLLMIWKIRHVCKLC